MKRAGLIATICLLALGSLRAQQFTLEPVAGATLGWWIYNNGWSATEPPVHQGIDQTHLAVLYPFSVSAGLKFGRWHLGAGGGFLLLMDDIMRRPMYRSRSERTYDISNTASVAFPEVFLFGEFSAVELPNYSFAPRLVAGTFWENSIHPYRDEFGFKFCWTVGTTHVFRLAPAVSLVLRPVYRSGHIFMQNGNPFGKSSTVKSFGAEAGIRIGIGGKQ